MNKLISNFAFLTLIVLMVSCASTSSILRKTAAEDWRCEADGIEVKNLDGVFWEAAGCGKRAKYACRRCAFGPLECEVSK